LAEIVKTKHEYYTKHVVDIKAIKPVVTIVETYKNALPMAVASGSTRKFVHVQLKAIRIFDCFKVILTAKDPIKPKPEPDIYLEAAKHMHVEPK